MDFFTAIGALAGFGTLVWAVYVHVKPRAASEHEKVATEYGITLFLSRNGVPALDAVAVTAGVSVLPDRFGLVRLDRKWRHAPVSIRERSTGREIVTLMAPDPSMEMHTVELPVN